MLTCQSTDKTSKYEPDNEHNRATLLFLGEQFQLNDTIVHNLHQGKYLCSITGFRQLLCYINADVNV